MRCYIPSNEDMMSVRRHVNSSHTECISEEATVKVENASLVVLNNSLPLPRGQSTNLGSEISHAFQWLRGRDGRSETCVWLGRCDWYCGIECGFLNGPIDALFDPGQVGRDLCVDGEGGSSATRAGPTGNNTHKNLWFGVYR